MARSAGLRRLQRLSLGWCAAMDDRELTHLTGLQSITALELARTQVSPKH